MSKSKLTALKLFLKCVFSNLNISVCGQVVDMCDCDLFRSLFHLQLNLVSGEVLIFVCLILGNCHILASVKYLINIAAISMDHHCGL